MARLENWAVISVSGPYSSPEARKFKLVGAVYGHRQFKDGTVIETSTLLELDVANNHAKTCGTKYELGTIDPKYAEFRDSHPKPKL